MDVLRPSRQKNEVRKNALHFFCSPAWRRASHPAVSFVFMVQEHTVQHIFYGITAGSSIVNIKKNSGEYLKKYKIMLTYDSDGERSAL